LLTAALTINELKFRICTNWIQCKIFTVSLQVYKPFNDVNLNVCWRLLFLFINVYYYCLDV